MIHIGKIGKNGNRWQASVLGLDYEAKVTVPASEYNTAKRAHAGLLRKAEENYGHLVKDPPPLPSKLGIHRLRIDDLISNVVQPEVRTTNKALRELRASIACYGPQGVVIVVREDNKWVLVDGHRTAKAASQCGYEYIWAVELWGDMALDSVTAFGRLNDKQRPVTGKEWLTVWAKAPISKRGSVLDEARGQRANIQLLISAIGVHRSQQLGLEGKVSPNIAGTANLVLDLMTKFCEKSSRKFKVPKLGEIVEYMLHFPGTQGPVRKLVEQVQAGTLVGDKLVWMRAISYTIRNRLNWDAFIADVQERSRRAKAKG